MQGRVQALRHLGVRVRQGVVAERRSQLLPELRKESRAMSCNYTYEQWREISDAIGDAMQYAHDRAIEHPDKADPLWNLDEYVNRVMATAFGGPEVDPVEDMLHVLGVIETYRREARGAENRAERMRELVADMWRAIVQEYPRGGFPDMGRFERRMRDMGLEVDG